MKLLLRFALVASVPVWAQVSPIINGLPSREFGQSTLLNQLTSGAPNLIEGREFNTPLAIAFAPNGGPVYVADSSNNRVLAWLNPADLIKGKPADMVIGQRDLASNFPKGPGSDLSSGLTSPSSVAVDSAGNLYVLDTGNNRILRYLNPVSTNPLTIDLVIGQKTQNSNTPNEGQTGAVTPKPTEHSLWFTSRSAIALDSNGNLWVADNGNNRVLRFPADSTKLLPVPPAGQEPKADKVLGQNGSFVTDDAPSCGTFFTCQTNLFVLSQPQSLAFDGNGALYVADGFARVLYYSNPSTQLTAAQVLGVFPTPTAGQQVTFPNDYSLGAGQGAPGPSQNAPLGLFATGNTIFVADAQANRVVRYTAPASFTSTTNVPSPKIEGVIGQADLFSGKANRGQIEPDATTLNVALGGAFDNLGNLWIADSFNNRVLFYPANGSFNLNKATGVGGQTDFPFNSPNLIEGKEVWFYNGNLNGTPFGGGIVVDKKSSPPHLYIADTFNNRILGFRDARSVGADARSILTQKADLVIGQPAGDFFRAIANWPGGDPQVPTQTGLQLPVGLAVDDNGNVWVADSGNGRVLRFPAPFSVAAGTIQTADLVLGQSDFTHKDQSATDHTMNTPYGLAFFPIVDPTTGQVLGQSHLAVSDASLNRVLVFQTPFTNGKPAFTVVGQKSFGTPGSPASTLADLNNPRNVATDTSGRLYVADSGNNRVLVFSDTSTIRQTGPAAPFNFPFNQPVGIAVSTISGEMWVTSGNVIFHLPEVTKFSTNTNVFIQQIGSASPLAIVLDSFENPVVAEAFNRVTFYFAQLVVRNAFSFTVQRFLTPGMWAQAAPLFKTFSASDAVHQDPPYPTTLSGLQMLVNGTPSAMYSVEQNAYINFVIPWEAPTTGTAEFLLFNPTTKEIVAAGTFGMTLADPAIRTTNFLGWGQVMANNYKPDNTFYGPNGPQNPISQGDTLQLALTGQGLVANPPADGFPPSSQTMTPDVTVYINGQPIPSKNVVSVLDPTYPGSWTINVVIPTVAQNGPPPCSAASIVVAIRVDYFSNFGYDHNQNNPYGDIPLQAGSNACPPAGGNGFITTFAVK